MTPEIDFAKLAASVIQGQINNAVAAASKGIRSVVAKVLATITKDLTKYTEAKIRKCSYVRTPIINRDHSTHIYNIYVQTRLRMRRNLVTDRTFIAGLSNRASFVIAGNAGSGKSMFMRHLFLELCKAERSKIPLFFELREINASEKKDIKEFLYYNLIGSNATITESQFLDSLKAGVFSLILDGFDEINHKDRKEIETQIIKLREQCPDLQIIVSSRPDADRRLESWEAFDTVYVEPLEEPQATELIDKLEYDAKIKEKFLKEAKSRLFVTHKTFLSNPLLCIMMLVTFEQTGHIPTKRHVFYEKAFDALFSIHDAAKEGVYKRKTYSNLSVDEFRNCMSAFCMVTYLQELFIFTKSQFRAALQKALELERLEINIDDLTSDMIESTCLIQIEGTDYAFTHRSFQEYFAALFISRSPAVGAKALLDSIARRNTDDVISMAFAINRGLIEREWIIPTLERVSNSATAQALQNDPVAFVEEHVGTILMQIQPNGLPTINLGWVGPRVALLTIGGLYENEILNIALSSLVATRKDQEEANAYYNRMVLKHDERLKRLGKSRYLVLSLQDLDLIRKTSIPSTLGKFLVAIREALSSCRQAVDNQGDILTKLTEMSRQSSK